MTVSCTQCGASFGERDVFCTKCGARRDGGGDLVPTQRFCNTCGAPFVGEGRFCTKCGATTSASSTPRVTAGPQVVSRATPTEAAVAPATVPAGKGRRALLMIVLVIVGFVVLLGMAGVGGVIYVGYRAKKKVAEIERTYDIKKMARGSAAAPASGGSNEGDSSASSNNAGATQKQNDGGTAPPPASGPAVLPPGALASSAAAVTPARDTPIVVTGEETKQWALKYERTEGGPEADLVVRTGDINNLGFGWDPGFDPFSGKSTQPHFFPWTARADEPDGTDRIMIASVVTAADVYARLKDAYMKHDGYSETLLQPCCAVPQPNAPPNQARLDSMPRPITLQLGALPAKIDAVVLQVFVDDFQPVHLHSHFQVTLNGTRIPQFEDAINALDQTGPIGKLITLRLLPEYWPLVQSGTVKLLFDDPTTHVPDGYAIDFARVLVNPHPFKYQVSLSASVMDADQHTPITGATVTAGSVSQSTDSLGQCQLSKLAAGLVVVTAMAPGYDESSATLDLVAGQTGKAVLQLHRHDEGTAALERAVAQTGSATVYGIHFDTDSAKLRADSAPALAAVLGLVNNHPGSRWLIEGHTDNEGSATHNQTLSEARAASVVSWLTANGVAGNRLVPQGFGATRPVADNATANGRALNRRVEIAPAK